MAAAIAETDSSRTLNAVNFERLGFTGALVGALLVGLELGDLVGDFVGEKDLVGALLVKEIWLGILRERRIWWVPYWSV